MARSKSGGHPGGDLMLRDNPAWAGREVKDASAYEFCHDGTPFLSIACTCGGQLHVHLGQIDHVPDDDVVGLRCTECRHPMFTPAGFVKSAIRKAWKLEGD